MHYNPTYMNIYFSGIGGVGIGPLAEIARDAGYSVQGSDAQRGPIFDRLEQSGVRVSTDQTGAFLEECNTEKPVDWFVYTAALPEHHPELVLAQALGIRTAKRDELLSAIIADKGLQLIAVAGTHGKTTTTGMMVWTMQRLGIPVSYSVGTTLSFGPSGRYEPGSKYFVYECDEFDRNFLAFTPHLSVITSIDYDHPDTYPTEGDYISAFKDFIHQSTATIIWQHGAEYLSLNEPTIWCLQRDEVFNLSIAGEHNRRNATLVLKALERLGLGAYPQNQTAIASFPGTDRRFQKLDKNLYSDYGHHPVEIAATLQLAREVSTQVVLVYQPHQNVRQHEIQDQYTDCMELADTIYWLPTYLTREDSALEILSPEHLTAHLTNQEALHIVDLDEELWDMIQSARHAGKLVLCMGAGTIDAWVREHLRAHL